MASAVGTAASAVGTAASAVGTAASAVGAAASAAAIYRAVQKDEAFLQQLHAAVADVVQRLKGGAFYLQHDAVVTLLTQLTYGALTTLSLRQTLGEEYTGLLLLHSSRASLPSTWRLHAVVWLQALGAPLGRLLLRLLQQSLSQGLLHSLLHPQLCQTLLLCSSALHRLAAPLHRLHLALFFMRGVHYHIAKRVAGVRYVSIRSWLNDHSTDSSLRFLGRLMLLQLLLQAVPSLCAACSSSERPDEGRDEGVEVQDAEVCRLCLCRRTNAALCPCGHVFCWRCIHGALAANQARCPLCRYAVQPRDVIPLKNFQ
ncbi:peroxisome biogenesis factor 10-like [Hyalella azteca]|uniref:RING-type E3 ubiquitin transferase n=1 Tax=Hyalella azteca TaxID=294128 RepID=A0A8B7P756_HYAAZ|nr:peroxisome biogenesis factor 10-like [Hyalella azteca]